LENLKRKDLSIDEKIMLKCNFRDIHIRMWAGFIWLKIGPSRGVKGCMVIDPQDP